LGHPLSAQLQGCCSSSFQFRGGSFGSHDPIIRYNRPCRVGFSKLNRGQNPIEGQGADGDPASAGEVLVRAQRIDAQLRRGAPDGWRGVLAKELTVKGLIYNIVQDTALVEDLFPVIKAQSEY
jgi:hypothetical protein